MGVLAVNTLRIVVVGAYVKFTDDERRESRVCVRDAERWG